MLSFSLAQFFAAGLVHAAEVRPSFLAGLMTPPSSQYYYYVYGGQLDASRDQDQGLLRIQYLKRPEFNSLGYVDQDYSGLALVGTSVLKRGEFGVTTLVGGGYTWGYIKSTENPADENSYKIPGLAVAIEGRWSPKGLDVRLTHQVFVGHSSTEQLKAYVAWPFNWFVISVSRPIEIRG